MDEVVYITKAAKVLGISASYLRRLERRGRIPVARRDTFGARIYTMSDLALLQALGVGRRPRKLRRLMEVLEAVQ